MEIFIVANPSDRINPAKELVASTGHVVYHGTHSSHSSSIEELGFRTDVQDPLRMDSIAAIVAACDKLHILPDGHAVATGLGHGHKSFFTRFYPSARDYAAAPGGERADGAMRAARGFLDRVTSPDLLHKTQEHWRKVLSTHGRHHATELVLRNLEDSSLVQELAHIVRQSLNELEARYLAGCPVVYMVRNLSEDGGDPEKDATSQLERFGGIQRIHVPADRIIARMDFVNGIDPKSLYLHADML